MRQPLAANVRRRQVAKPATIPASVEGWDASSPLAAMKPARAIILENLFPRPGFLELRKGFSSHATGVGSGAVETVMTYEGLAASKLFAASSTVIYDATSAGAASSAVTSQTNGRWQWINYNTSAKTYLYAVNGEDKPELYDGSSWVAVDGTSTPAITGVTTTGLINVSAFKRRVYFVETGSTSVWYLPVDAVGGAATEYDIGPMFPSGGYLMACGSWTRDSGNGPDDYFVAISSRGDVAIFQGDYPGGTWSIIGMFRIGAPLGRRCFTKVGADLAVITIDGVLPLSRALGIDRGAANAIAITSRISNAMNAAARLYGGNYGWQLIGYPKGTMAILNVPTVASTTAEQYVMNTLTGAWCKFSGINAFAWSLLGDDIYFGGAGGKVYKFDTGTDDGGAAITYDWQAAWNYFNSRELKEFAMLAPLIGTDGAVSPAVALLTDYEDRTPTAVPAGSAALGVAWDDGDWDVFDWAGGVTVTRNWNAVEASGVCASVRIRGQATGAQMQINAVDLLYQPGGIV